jgi:hypothetical protein
VAKKTAREVVAKVPLWPGARPPNQAAAAVGEGGGGVAEGDADAEGDAASGGDAEGDVASVGDAEGDGDDCTVALGVRLAEALVDAELDGGTGAPATLARRTWAVDARLLPK